MWLRQTATSSPKPKSGFHHPSLRLRKRQTGEGKPQWVFNKNVESRGHRLSNWNAPDPTRRLPLPHLCVLTCRIPLPSEFLNLCQTKTVTHLLQRLEKNVTNTRTGMNVTKKTYHHTLKISRWTSKNLTSFLECRQCIDTPTRLVWWVLGCRISGTWKMNFHVCCYVDVTFATFRWKENNGRPASGGVLTPEHLRATRSSETHCNTLYIYSILGSVFCVVSPAIPPRCFLLNPTSNNPEKQIFVKNRRFNALHWSMHLF